MDESASPLPRSRGDGKPTAMVVANRHATLTSQNQLAILAHQGTSARDAAPPRRSSVGTSSFVYSLRVISAGSDNRECVLKRIDRPHQRLCIDPSGLFPDPPILFWPLIPVFDCFGNTFKSWRSATITPTGLHPRRKQDNLLERGRKPAHRRHSNIDIAAPSFVSGGRKEGISWKFWIFIVPQVRFLEIDCWSNLSLFFFCEFTFFSVLISIPLFPLTVIRDLRSPRP